MVFKKNVFILVIAILFLSTEVFAYTLPSVDNMIQFLPDKIGDWVGDEIDWPEMGGDPSRVFRTYKKGNTTLYVSINANIWEDYGDEDEEDDEDPCDLKYKEIKVGEYDAIEITVVCNNIPISNGLMILFMLKELGNYLYFQYDVQIGTVGPGLLSIEELHALAKSLDLKGIRSLAKN